LKAETVRKMKWGVERRYEFIEFRLYWEGRINRADLTTVFGISTPQASMDLNAYIKDAPNNLSYDKSAKTYVRGKKFKARYFRPDPEEYFAQLSAIHFGLVSSEQSWIKTVPHVDATPRPERDVDSEILREFLSAIRERVALLIVYQSMSTAEPSRRVIEPHAFASDGFRWHVRAYSQKDEEFRDFVLSRVREIIDHKDCVSSPEQDLDWSTEIILEIAPHPHLSPQQSAVIQQDYGMVKGSKKIPVRKALVFYALQQMRLDPRYGENPLGQQIVLLNATDVLNEINMANEWGC